MATSQMLVAINCSQESMYQYKIARSESVQGIWEEQGLASSEVRTLLVELPARSLSLMRRERGDIPNLVSNVPYSMLKVGIQANNALPHSPNTARRHGWAARGVKRDRSLTSDTTSISKAEHKNALIPRILYRIVSKPRIGKFWIAIANTRNSPLKHRYIIPPRPLSTNWSGKMDWMIKHVLWIDLRVGLIHVHCIIIQATLKVSHIKSIHES